MLLQHFLVNLDNVSIS